MANKADTWMPLYIADYLRKTMHLTRDQHGAYMLLLMACWDRGGRLPNDPGQLAGIARATLAEWRKLSPVILPFFEVEGAFLTQGRVLEEREKAQRISEARRDAGRQGGRPKKQTGNAGESTEQANAFANREQTETHARVRSSPSPSSDPNGSAAGAASDGLDDLRALDLKTGSWRLALKLLMSRGGYPEARARTMVGKWAKDHAPPELWKAAEAAWQTGTLDPVAYVTKALANIADDEDDPLKNPTETRQRLWMQDFKAGGEWREHERGPKPGSPGCRVTAEIQREFGVEPAAPQVVRGAAA